MRNARRAGRLGSSQDDLDIRLLSQRQQFMERRLAELQKEAENEGLKTKVVIIRFEQHAKLTVNGEKAEQVDSFTCLDNII